MLCCYDNLTALQGISQYVRFLECSLKIFGNSDGFTRHHVENLVLFIIICGNVYLNGFCGKDKGGAYRYGGQT